MGLPFKKEIAKLDDKLERLLDAKLEGLITSAEYTNRKEKLIKQKLLASENLKQSQTQGNRRLEPLKYFLQTCQEAQKVAHDGDSLAVRSFLKNVGSNFLLHAQTVACEPGVGFRVLASRPKNTVWLALLEKLRTEFAENP